MLLKGQWVEVDRNRLSQAIEHWDAVRQAVGDGGISFVEGMRLLAGAPADLRAEADNEAERRWVHVEAGDGMREILAGMRRPESLAAVHDGELQGTLRPYQRDGVAWLSFLTRLGLGACLADDMGLGKTIQVLALLLSDRRGAQEEQQQPSLLVIPASLLGNWRAEAERFAPVAGASIPAPVRNRSRDPGGDRGRPRAVSDRRRSRGDHVRNALPAAPAGGGAVGDWSSWTRRRPSRTPIPVRVGPLGSSRPAPASR